MGLKWLSIPAVALLVNAGMASAEPPDLAGVLTGDRWLYDVTDELTGETKYTMSVVVIDVSDKEILARVSSRGIERPRQVAFDLGWSRIDDEVWKFQPSDGAGMQLPLQVGKDWRFENNAKNLSNGVTLRTTGQSKVTTEEKVTTSAGTFDAFKVETVMRHVSSNDPTKAATVKTTLWYAPTVNRWVRRAYRMEREGRLRESTIEELTDYSRKP
jgi:hypothetical protein